MKIGIVVGRFQTPYLHAGHIQLLNEAVNSSEKTIVIIGTAHKSRDNSLNYETRKLMIQTIYPNIEFHSIADRKHDSVWTKNLDIVISDNTDENDDVILYGGRDSCLDTYNGKYTTKFVDTDDGYSGTKLREECATIVLSSTDYRIGVIAGEYQRYPTTFSTVDAIVEKYIDGVLHILLGQKPFDVDKNLWVFPGGFIDKGDRTGRNAASREVREETSLGIAPRMFKIFDQIEIDDWRYKRTENTIFTTVYTVEIEEGWQDYMTNHKEKAADDLHAIKWVAVDDIEDHLSDVHIGIWNSYKENKLEKTKA